MLACVDKRLGPGELDWEDSHVNVKTELSFCQA